MGIFSDHFMQMKQLDSIYAILPDDNGILDTQHQTQLIISIVIKCYPLILPYTKQINDSVASIPCADPPSRYTLFFTIAVNYEARTVSIPTKYTPTPSYIFPPQNVPSLLVFRRSNVLIFNFSPCTHLSKS